MCPQYGQDYKEILRHRIFENLVEWCTSFITTLCMNCEFYLVSDDIIMYDVRESIVEVIVSLFKGTGLVFLQHNSSG
jgi:hypothetical protein